MRNRGRNTLSYKMKMKMRDFSFAKTTNNVSQILTGLVVATAIFILVFIFIPNFVF